MNASEREKRNLELSAARRFASIYSRQYETPAIFLTHNLPAKPDVTCRIGNNKQDIEIAHLYGSEAEAQSILGKPISPSTCDELKLQHAQSNTDDRLVAALNRILQRKAEKHYASDNVWLVIQNAHPHWHGLTIQANLCKVNMPSQHPLSQVWLISSMRNNAQLIRLYP